jgi:RNA polymerase sigma-70 factor (ECF subfamily)
LNKGSLPSALSYPFPSRIEQQENLSNDQLFEWLMDIHYKRVYNYIYRMVRNEQDAADITQEAFVRIYKALPRLRNRDSLPFWIRRIATNLCLDHLHKRMNSPEIMELDKKGEDGSPSPIHFLQADPAQEPMKILHTSERARVLLQAIDTLPDEYRTVILLHHIDGQPLDEIARILHVPAGTVKSRLSRARLELRRRTAFYFEP